MNSVIPDGWEKLPIGNHIDLLTDYTANGSFSSLKENVTYYNEKNYAALVRTTDLQKKQFVPVRFTDKQGYEFLSKSALIAGDIVIANVGSAGKAYRVPYCRLPMTLAPNMYLVKFSETLNPDLAYQIITDKKFYDDLMRNVGSSTLNAINKTNFRSIEIFTPPKPEQQKIASILTSVDDVIEKTESQISKLQDLKKSMMQELLTKGIGHTEFKDSAVGRIPVGWEERFLQQICSSRYAIVDGPFGSNLKTEHYRESGIPVFQSGFVTSNKFIKKNYVYVDQEKYDEQRRSSAGPNDILMAKIGMNAGACAIIPVDHVIGILAGNSLKMTVDTDKALNYFILSTLHLMQYTGEIRRLLTETAQPAISITTLKKLQLALPSLGEQERIVSILSSIDKNIGSKQQKLQQGKSLKKSLMQDLLTGYVRVKV